MDKKQIFIAIAIVSLVNGLFSPFLVVVLSLVPFWMPEFVPASMPLALALSAIITAFGTLLLSGIPAAIYERLSGSSDSTSTSMYVWLGVALLMSLPAVGVIGKVV